MCPLDEFKEIANPCIPDNWKHMCGIDSHQDAQNNANIAENTKNSKNAKHTKGENFHHIVFRVVDSEISERGRGRKYDI